MYFTCTFSASSIILKADYQLNINDKLHWGLLIMHLFKFFLFSPDNFFVDDFARFSALDSRGKTAAIANSMNYLTKKGKTSGLVLDPTYFFFT